MRKSKIPQHVHAIIQRRINLAPACVLEATFNSTKLNSSYWQDNDKRIVALGSRKFLQSVERNSKKEGDPFPWLNFRKDKREYEADIEKRVSPIFIAGRHNIIESVEVRNFLYLVTLRPNSSVFVKRALFVGYTGAWNIENVYVAYLDQKSNDSEALNEQNFNVDFEYALDRLLDPNIKRNAEIVLRAYQAGGMQA